MNNFLKEWIPYVLIVLVVFFVRSYIVTPVVVRGDSMDVTLHDGQVLFLSKISYKLEKIKRFDIVVIRDEDNDLIIKRVIGMPGDYVEYKNNKLYINYKEVEDKYAFGETEDFDLNDICEIREDECKRKIPNDRYLALGDNREVSADSRVKGLFYRDQILGKATLRIWPLNKIKVVK